MVKVRVWCVRLTFFFCLFHLTAASAAPGILSPPDGSVLSGSSETFTWSADGTVIDRWRLEVGTAPDTVNLFASSFASSITSVQVNGLPTDGSSVHVNLKWRVNGVVSVASYVYTAFDDSVPPANIAPTASAGVDQAIVLPIDTVTLSGVATDDGLPLGVLNLTWSMLSGPAAVSFLDPTQASTSATFVAPGDYVLQFDASDTLLNTSDQMSVTVHASAVLTTIQVTPGSTVLLASETQQFVANGLDQTGEPYAITPDWAATGGSIDTGGLYAAGVVTGQFEVTPSAEGVLGQADIFIIDNLGPWPTNGWQSAIPADMGMEQSLLEQARDYALTGGGSGMITRHGQVVLSWGDTSLIYDVNSVTKSIGALLLGLAVKDNIVTLSDLAQTHYPAVGANPATNVSTGWLNEITIMNLATHSAGFAKPAGYVDMIFQPGTAWAYSDAGFNWLADTLTVANQSDLLPILDSRILSPLGVTTADYSWSNSVNRDTLVEGFVRRELNSDIDISVDAMARVGYLALRNGSWDSQNIIQPAFIDQMRATVPSVTGLPVSNDLDSKYSGAPEHYGIGWWNNADGALPNVPTDAYWAWGVGDFLILVIPSLDIVASRAGTPWAGSRTPSYYPVLGPFFDPIAQSVTTFGNLAPTVDAGFDDSIALPTTTLNLVGIVSDDGLPDGTLDIAWSQIAGPATVVFGNETLAATSATFTNSGEYTLRLTATDGLASASDDVLITVLPEPDSELPVVAITQPISNDTVSGLVTVTATATDNDSVVDVEFFAAGVSIGVDATSPYSVIWNSTVAIDGDHDIAAFGRDPTGNESGDSIMVTVDNAAAANQPPVVGTGVGGVITLPTDTFGLSGTAIDDGLPSGSLTTTWSAINPPFAVTFADASALTTTATFAGSGSYLLRLTADDGALTASADVTVTVNPDLTTDPQTFVAIADNTINGSQPTRVIGGGEVVQLHSSGPKVGLVQFDLSSLTGSSVSAASFRFRLNSLRSNGDINIQLVDEAWSEDSVNYDNQPSFGATVLTVPVTMADVGTVVSVDVTGIVQSWIDGLQPSHGFRLATSQSINAFIDSRESSGTPMDLLVTLASLPVPALVPNVVGLTQAGAEAAIVAVNLVVGTVTTQNDAAVPAGHVIAQNPIGGIEVASGAAVDIVVSLGPLTVPPSLTLVSPQDGATLSGWLRLSANASDDVGVSSVSFSVDGNEVSNIVGAPYEFDWDSNTLSSGTHSLTVTATDTDGNQTSELATIYVDSLLAQPSSYPPSSIISGVQWAPSAEISRAAMGGDNWPITWADDDNMYAAYGDGQGFEPPAPQRLSLGYARISGPPTAIVGTNIPSPSGEHVGDGPSGKKASGILMVDGVLYLWVRNANNNGEQCELAWSTDRAVTWAWSGWQFAEFGYCAFLNFGQDYVGARDSYVYMYTPDTPSAYLETNSLILTRVQKDQITDRSAYEFFAGDDGFGNPVWSSDIASRQAVFTFDGAANRLDVTYQPTLGRYLMTLRSRAQNGGLNQFSIFEAREPWGSWSAVYFTESWEGSVTASDHREWGEAQHIPSKWMSADGTEFHLVFSGEDSFTVRRANLTLVPDTMAPSVSILQPGEGEAIAGPIQISATASDNYAIKSVAFEVDGLFIGEIFWPPYALDWDSRSVAPGDHVLTTIATDTSGNQSSSAVNVSVFRDMQAPMLVLDSPLDGSTVAGAVLVSATVSDDIGVASVSLAIGPTSLGTLTNPPFEWNWDTTVYVNGAQQLTATAFDTSGNSAIAAVSATVQNVNLSPQVDAGPDQTVSLPVGILNLDGTVSDDGLPVGGNLTTSWSSISGPAAVVFANSAAVDTTATFSTVGDYVLQLSADDGEQVVNDTLNVTVELLVDTESPIVIMSRPAQGSTVSGVVSVAATATDNIAIASVSFAVGPTPLGTLTSTPYELNWDTRTYTNGAHQVTAIATDTSGNTGSSLVDVTLNNVNVPPVVDAGVGGVITLPTDTIGLGGTAIDDGLPSGSLTTTWSAINPPFAVTFADASALTTTATFAGSGSYLLRLTADDGALTASADVTVTVNPDLTTDPQTFVAIADNTINGAQPTRVIGGGTVVQAHSFGPKVGLVQFDLSSLTGSSVSAASFRFRLSSLASNGDISIQLVDEAWSEDSVNYGNQPSFGATVLTVPVTMADVGTVISVDVTGIVQSWVDGSQPSHGFRLATSQSINASMDSRESSGIPMDLLVTVDNGVSTVSAPSISPNGGSSATPVQVTLATVTPGASIYYTLDGSIPTSGSNSYTAPFTLDASATVKARATAPGLSDSVVASADFVINSALTGDLNNYWSLNEIVGASYANNVGSTAGTCINCPTPTSGLVNGAQSFDGTNDVISVADDGSADWVLTAGFTVEFWVNKNNACTAREVVVGRHDGGTAMQWAVGCDSGTAFFELTDANGTSATAMGSSAIDDGAWHHIVAVYDAFYDEIRLYKDGGLDASASVTYATGFASAADITIGELQNGLSDTFFNGVVDEVALHDRAIPVSLIARHHLDGSIGLHGGYTGCSAPVKFMPLGDSNTNRLGYRPTLYFDLIDRGLDVDFVGSRSDNPAAGTHDRDHEGWSGFTTTDIAANLDGWLSGNPPDVVFLHIGTNDIDIVTAAEAIIGLAGILDIIHAFDPDITVVLGQIINRQTFSQETADYNEQMLALAQTKLAAGYRILLVDHENALTYPDDMVDLEHANDSGYAKMAGVWLDGATDFLPACNAAAPIFRSVASSSGQVAIEYRYQPTVLGNPVARFTALTSPAGMRVHPDTGEVRWVPSAAGQYNVDLQIQNSAGSQVQGFILTIP